MEETPRTSPTDPRAGKPAGMPRWVKAFAVVGVLVVVLAILMLTGVLGKGHGPGRHLGRSDAMNQESDSGRTIEVAASDVMSFEPDHVAVAAGETITFAVTNMGKAVHEFTLGDSTMQQQHADMMAHIPAGMGHDTPNSITLKPNETKRLTWRFGAAGTLEFACHQPGHYGAGMRGRITVG